MDKRMSKLKDSSLIRLYNSFTPASRAAIWFAIPFTLLDSVHYYTAGTALVFSLPLLVSIYIWCGASAARIARKDGRGLSDSPRLGVSAALRLWLLSTVINTLVSALLGLASMGITILSGAAYLCLFAPVHALVSAGSGWLGGRLYQEYARRTEVPQ